MTAKRPLGPLLLRGSIQGDRLSGEDVGNLGAGAKGGPHFGDFFGCGGFLVAVVLFKLSGNLLAAALLV